MLVKLFGNHLQ